MTNEKDGKKIFGLILKKKPTKHTLDTLIKANRPSIFTDDDVETVDTNMMEKTDLSASESRVKKQAERAHAKALAEDPSIFDYDAVHDKLQNEKLEKLVEQQAVDKDRKPKYMQALLKSSRKRELEQQSREERKQQKERVIEGEQFGDKEAFVTGAYRTQMEELRQFKEQQGKDDRIEELLDVTKQKDYLSGFYRNMLKDITGQGELKKEKLDSDSKDELTDKRMETDDKETSMQAATENKDADLVTKKPKSYRHRRHSSSGDENDKRQNATDKNKSIYSHESDESEQEEQTKECKMKSTVQVAQKVRSGLTKAEQQKRRFTPTPPSSPNKESKHHKQHRSTDKRQRSRSPRKRRHSEKMKEASMKRKTEEKIEKSYFESRLDRLKAVFKKRNTQEQIEEYRQQYFARKAEQLILPPV